MNFRHRQDQTAHLPTIGQRRFARRCRRAFSFVEVLFAVMILGIGFIMIAGVFPVAISQTAQTQDETVAAACARGGVSAFASVPGLLQIVPANGEVIRLMDTDPTKTPPVPGPWSLIKGNQILPQDRRYAWIPLLKRDLQDFKGQPPTTAQLFIIAVQVRGRSNFDPTSDLVQRGRGGLDTSFANLMAWPVEITIGQSAGNPDTVDFTASKGFPSVAAPGAVLIIRKGPTAGRIYRLGNRPDDSKRNHFELLRGSDTNTDTSQAGKFQAWIVGQGMATPNNSGTLRNGNMAISVYTTYINLK